MTTFEEYAANTKDYPDFEKLWSMRHPLPMPDGIDKGIERLVRILRYEGIDTCQSCQGGDGHASLYPFVQFYGDASEGYRGLSIALQWKYEVDKLQRVYPVYNDDIGNPYWQLTLKKADPVQDDD